MKKFSGSLPVNKQRDSVSPSLVLTYKVGEPAAIRRHVKHINVIYTLSVMCSTGIIHVRAM